MRLSKHRGKMVKLLPQCKKKTLTGEIVEELFQSVQLGPADTTNPSQLQNTVWFQLLRL